MTIGALMRFLLPVLAGAGAAILAAANWMDPNDPLAGALLGYAGVCLGALSGLIWSGLHERREARR